jgi:uracil-DNA glycosylase
MSLEEIYAEIAEHPTNAAFREKGYAPVYAASPEAKIVIISQAPGRKAQESGTPWNDVSGDTLRAWLGMNRDTFYSKEIAIIPMDFYYPGKALHGDLPPRKEFAQLWHEKILQEMPHVELALLVGQYAQKYYLKGALDKNLTETVRNYKNHLPKYFVLVHPSPLNGRWLTNNPWFEEEIIPDLRARVAAILR